MNQGVSKLGGLFSRVVRFVRACAGQGPAHDAPELPEKQALRQTVERKRRNDLVRQQEFEKLRQMRQKAHSPEPGEQALTDTAVPVSGLHRPQAAADFRAITRQKIDAIEEQMSQQWWSSQLPDDALPDPVPAVPPLAEAGSPAASAASAAGPPGAIFPAPQDARPAEAAVSLAPPAPGFVHDPDLEEAAIVFANGDALAAEALLLEVLAQRAGQPETQGGVWQALFDLYRAAGLAERFEVLAIDFAARVGRSAPLWFSLPEQLDLAEPGAPQGGSWCWTAPDVLTQQSVATPLEAATGTGAGLAPGPAVQSNAAAHLLGQARLAGSIVSDATPWLTALEARACPGVPLVVDCAQLIRLDFAAAGSVLNWSARMQGQGHRLRFERLHQLVAVFFCMIGVNEHAQLVPRND